MVTIKGTKEWTPFYLKNKGLVDATISMLDKIKKQLENLKKQSTKTEQDVNTLLRLLNKLSFE